MKNIRLCILGKPGSGKGVISELLTATLRNYFFHLGMDFHIEHFNVGQRLRRHAELTNDQHIKQVHSEGGLVGSDKVLSIFDSALEKDNFILDGSPRKPEEADYILNHKLWKDNPGMLVYLDLPDEVSMNRLLQRNRFDDVPQVIQKRFEAFHDQTIQSIRKFADVEKIITVDATQDPKQIVLQILSKIDLDD